jgi:hypothetical protein
MAVAAQPPGGRPAIADAKPSEPGPSTRARAVPGKSVVSVLEGADMTDPEVRARVVAEMRALQQAQDESVEEKARRLGIPIRIDGPGHKVSILHDFRGDEPLYRTTKNRNAAISTGANLLAPAPYNLSGQGIKVGVWDGGSVRSTHQELTGRVTKKNSSAANDDHATHVAGTIAASGVQPAAKGMAPQATLDSYDWNSDYTEMTAAGTASASDTTGIPLSNHSYGYNATTSDMGRYEDEAVAVDAIAASLPYYLPFWAAGNEQDVLTAKGGFQSITFNGLAKNVMTIGAVEDAVSGGVRAPANGTITSFSSLGPCDDGRVKPDLVANGVDVYSSIALSNTAYDGTYDGTSMATPNALGSAVLLAQLHAREFSGRRMRASTLKSLLIHTADDRGNPGPDYTYGWGLVNVKAAADLILAHKNSLASPKIIEGTITNAAKTVDHGFTWDGTSPIRATLCWTDPAGAVQSGADSRTPNLRHNLDVKITAPNGTTVYQPFVMPFVGTWSTASMSSAATTGKNNVDNVEQVYLATPGQSGTYTITVSLDGSLTTSNQVYSLIVTGGSSTPTNPPPDVAITAPAADSTYLFSGGAVSLAATASDLALGGAPGNVARVEFLQGTTSLGIDTSAPYEIVWSPPGPGSYALTAKATDNEGVSAVSAAINIHVLSGNGAPVVSSFAPGSGKPGSTVVLTGGNFAAVGGVRFNGVNADFTVDSFGQISAIVPANATTGRITVVNPYGSGESSGDYTILEAPVLISQIYGAGGNSGAVYNRDYVELHNRSEVPINLAGWSVQYASASGTSWQSVSLSGNIAPGKYHLIGLGSGSSGAALPTVDTSGTINMSATTGKVALLDTPTMLTGSSPLGNPSIQDFVGFGTANASEGSPAPAPSSTTAIFRLGGGSTDTGNNSADFTTGVPSPRNSSSGTPVLPVITSAATATGTVNTAFSYQISATNAPTSYGAGGLPAGLTVNTATGLISGIPTGTGTTNATITATNGAGTASANLAITTNPAAGGPALLSEDFASLSTGNNTTTTGASTAWAGNANFPNVSAAYEAGGCVKLGTSNAPGFLTSKTLDLSGNGGNFTVSFKVKGWTTVEGSIRVTPTGVAAQTASYTNVMSGGFATITFNFSGGQANSTIKFETTAKRAYLDDIVVSHTVSPNPPLITTTGTLGAADSIYGSPSATPTSFTVSGTNMSTGILVTPPAGFEVSQSGAGSGYAPTQAVGAAGTIASTTIHLRLAAGINAGSYSGEVVLTSAGAAPVTLPAAISEARPKLLAITANHATKPFGDMITFGSGQTAFGTSGLVGSETVGSVTLTASGGTSSNDHPGDYSITPSDATGGTFNPANYDIDYVAGILTVIPRSYADWLLLYPTLAQTGLTDDPDGDGQRNLMEYFAGTHPGISNAQPITFSRNGNILTFTYRRAKGTTGVTGLVRWSPDLTNATWSAAGINETSEDMGDHDVVTATLEVPPGTRGIFMRLEATRAP